MTSMNMAIWAAPGGVLTLRGNRFLAHLGESVANNAGMVDWIAANGENTDEVLQANPFAGSEMMFKKTCWSSLK